MAAATTIAPRREVSASAGDDSGLAGLRMAAERLTFTEVYEFACLDCSLTQIFCPENPGTVEVAFTRDGIEVVKQMSVEAFDCLHGRLEICMLCAADAPDGSYKAETLRQFLELFTGAAEAADVDAFLAASNAGKFKDFVPPSGK